MNRIFALLFSFILLLGAVACSSSSNAGTACTNAGGACYLGGATCAQQAPSSAQDCNPDLNPGGAMCCLGGTIPFASSLDGGADAADATRE